MDDEIINDVEVEDDDDDEDEGKDIVGIENARGLITEPQNHIGEEIESESGSDAESLASLKRKHTDSVWSESEAEQEIVSVFSDIRNKQTLFLLEILFDKNDNLTTFFVTKSISY